MGLKEPVHTIFTELYHIWDHSPDIAGLRIELEQTHLTFPFSPG